MLTVTTHDVDPQHEVEDQAQRIYLNLVNTSSNNNTCHLHLDLGDLSVGFNSKLVACLKTKFESALGSMERVDENVFLLRMEDDCNDADITAHQPLCSSADSGCVSDSGSHTTHPNSKFCWHWLRGWF